MFLCHESCLGRDLLFDMEQSRLQTLRLDRLGQIVKRMDFECFHRILIVRCHKHRSRHMNFADPVNELKAVVARHLNVEKKQVNLPGFEGCSNFPSVAAFLDQFDVLVSGQQEPEPLPRQRFVVGYDGFQRHARFRS